MYKDTVTVMGSMNKNVAFGLMHRRNCLHAAAVLDSLARESHEVCGPNGTSRRPFCQHLGSAGRRGAVDVLMSHEHQALATFTVNLQGLAWSRRHSRISSDAHADSFVRYIPWSFHVDVQGQ